MDTDWVRSYLTDALGMAATVGWTDLGIEVAAQAEELDRRARQLVACVERVTPGAGNALAQNIHTGSWHGVRTLLSQAIYTLDEDAEVQARLGSPPGPALRADALHTTVWDAATSLWRSEHYRQAVEAAAVAVNALLQQKVNRRDTMNTALVREAFTREPPAPGRPRLRLWPDDGSDTYKNLHDGVRDFGIGCFTAIRNVGSHEVLPDLDPQIALEQLAAFSILARWIEDATVIVAVE